MSRSYKKQPVVKDKPLVDNKKRKMKEKLWNDDDDDLLINYKGKWYKKTNK